MVALLLAVAFQAQGADALPALSPSIEHDADYLLTTDDFSSPQFGMRVEDVREGEGRLVVRTTGAEFVFDIADGTLHLRQRLGAEREAATVMFGADTLAGLKVEKRSDGAVRLTAAEGKLRMRINGDSLLMIRDERALAVGCEPLFSPRTAREYAGNFLLLDEYGGIGSYLATGPASSCTSRPGETVEYSLQPGQILWLAVAPPREYPWEASFRDRVCWHWSTKTGYPPDADIEQWSRYGNILLQQSEVMLWKDWSLRFIPRDGLAEFQRVNATCERLGMRNIVYTSPFYFLTGTGLESRAMNSFDNFAVTGFSPGDEHGLNWPIFVEEIRKVMRDYKPDGLYFDGIYGNVVRTYLLSRKAREIVGDDGILEYHATGSPPGGGVYLPQIDTYYSFILRGEGCQPLYTDPDYLRYFVSTYNVSNSIGVLCNNNDYPLDERFVNTLLDDNIRLHYLLGGPEDQRTQGMERYYWPALNDGLRERVARASEARQAATPPMWELLRRARESTDAGLRDLYEWKPSDPGLHAEVDANKDAEAPLPGGWRAYMSPHSEAKIGTDGQVLRIDARAHTVAYLERDLPADAVAVECRIRGVGDCGMSWGPGVLLRVGARTFRVGVRSDGQAQVDVTGKQMLVPDFPVGKWSMLRIRLTQGCVVFESLLGELGWRPFHVEYVGAVEGPRSIAVGKIPYDGSKTEYTDHGGLGACEIGLVRAYGAP
jgi:hypothetical protein